MSRADAIRAPNTQTSVRSPNVFICCERKFHLSKNDAEDRKEIVGHLQPSAAHHMPYSHSFVVRSFLLAPYLGILFGYCFFFFADTHESRLRLSTLYSMSMPNISLVTHNDFDYYLFTFAWQLQCVSLADEWFCAAQMAPEVNNKNQHESHLRAAPHHQKCRSSKYECAVIVLRKYHKNIHISFHKMGHGRHPFYLVQLFGIIKLKTSHPNHSELLPHSQ